MKEIESATPATPAAVAAPTPVLDDAPPGAERINKAYLIGLLRLRQVYENRVAEKNKEPGVNITPATQNRTISPEVLQIFVLAGWMAAARVKYVTEDMLKTAIE